MNWVIARCSCGQSDVLQCKSFKLLCVIPDLFFSFKHKPDQHGSTFQGEEKPLILPIFAVAFACVLRGCVVFFFLFFFYSWLVLVLVLLLLLCFIFSWIQVCKFYVKKLILHIILKVIFHNPGMIILKNPRACLAC